MNKLSLLISEKANTILPQLTAIRRHFHAHPELSFSEYSTSNYIKSFLTENNISFTEDWVKTGIVATIKGQEEGRLIAFRADMDALPIQEENEVSYKSTQEGIMHACGHDVHMACMMGAILIIDEFSSQLKGEVMFIFQPGEEKLPGGAKLMLEQGIFNERKPELIIGQHVYNVLPAGKVGHRSGQYMASADEIYISVKGKGGHAALPHLNDDTVLSACQTINSLQQVVSRKSNPLIPSVLSFGKIFSIGGATNVIPNEVKIEGTFRTMNEEWRAEAHALIHSICHSVSEANGTHCEVEILKGYPSLVNDEEITNRVASLMRVYLGTENVVEIAQRMTSEDFAFYSQSIPGCFYRLGIANAEKGIVNPVHNSKFDIDESALVTGSGLFAWLAFNMSNKP